MLRAESLRGDARVLQFVVAVLAKAYREGLDGTVARARHEGDDRRRVNAAREERAERNVRDEAHAHGIVERRAKLFEPVLFRARLVGLEREVPITFDAHAAVREGQMRAGREL